LLYSNEQNKKQHHLLSNDEQTLKMLLFKVVSELSLFQGIVNSQMIDTTTIFICEYLMSKNSTSI